MWSREEAVTRISALDFVGLLSAHYGSQAFPVMLDQDQSGNTLTMFLQRFYGQLLQIQVSIWNLPKVVNLLLRIWDIRLRRYQVQGQAA